MKLAVILLGAAIVLGAGYFWWTKTILGSRELYALKEQCLASQEDRVRTLAVSARSPQFPVDKMRTILAGMPNVETATYSSGEEILAEFKTKHADEPQILASLTELRNNPFFPEFVIVFDSVDHAQGAINGLRTALEENKINADVISVPPESLTRWETAMGSFPRNPLSWSAYKRSLKISLTECIEEK